MNCTQPSETRTLTREICLRIIDRLAAGPAGFGEFQRLPGAPSAPVLSRNLKCLQRDGLIARVIIRLGPPARVDYILTDVGRSMAAPARAMLAWIDGNFDLVMATRQISRLRAKAGEFTGQPADDLTP